LWTKNKLMILKERSRFPISRALQLLVYFIPLKVIAQSSFSCDFSTDVKILAVFGVADPQKNNCHYSEPSKALPWTKPRCLSQRALNWDAWYRLWTCGRKCEHIILILADLYWLQLSARINYKLELSSLSSHSSYSNPTTCLSYSLYHTLLVRCKSIDTKQAVREHLSVNGLSVVQRLHCLHLNC